MVAMQKQRNAVEKSLLEVSEQLKTVLAQRVYAVLAESGIERQKAIKILAVVNAAVDETINKYSRPFDKAVNDLVVAVSAAAAAEAASTGKPSKSAK